jgi:hypothetical protein
VLVVPLADKLLPYCTEATKGFADEDFFPSVLVKFFAGV